MHTTTNYSKSPAPKFDAVEDIKGHFAERWATVSPMMAKVTDTQAFRIAASFGGVEGFPVEAWFDLYHGEGAYKAGVAMEPEDAA